MGVLLMVVSVDIIYRNYKVNLMIVLKEDVIIDEVVASIVVIEIENGMSLDLVQIAVEKNVIHSMMIEEMIKEGDMIISLFLFRLCLFVLSYIICVVFALLDSFFSYTDYSLLF